MKNNNIIHILKTFSADEFRELEKFIASPFFAKGRNVMPLYKYLRKFYPEFSSPKMTAEDAFKKIYPGKEFTLQAIRNLMTTMQKMCEEYLFQINIKREKPVYSIHLIDELQHRRIFNTAQKILNEGLNEVKQREIDEDFFFYIFSLERLNDQVLLKKFKLDKERNKAIYNMSSYFLSYFIFVTNTVFYSIYAQSSSFNRAVDTNPLYIFIKDFVKLDAYMKYLKLNPSGFSEVDEMGLLLLNLWLNREDEESYTRLRTLLLKNINVISKWETYNIYSSLQQMAPMIELKNKKYKGLLFEIYKERLEYNVYSFKEDGPMQPAFFTGTVKEAAAAGEFKWAQNFIRKYKNKIYPAEQRENRINHSLAMIAFEEKNYEQAIKLISRIKYDVFDFKYFLKIMLIKIYYEQSRYDEAYSMIDTFKHFISKNKTLHQFRKDRYSAFIKFTYLILKLKGNKSGKNRIKIKNEIENEILLEEKNWLIEKVNELK